MALSGVIIAEETNEFSTFYRRQTYFGDLNINVNIFFETS